MNSLDALVETRIRGAIERGDFDSLPGAGHPLDLDDDRLVPEHLRMGYRILRNAGIVPPELDALRRLHEAGRMLSEARDEEAHRRARARLALLRTRVESLGLRHSAQAAWNDYASALVRHFARGAAAAPGADDR
jgi:hypothetical protein